MTMSNSQHIDLSDKNTATRTGVEDEQRRVYCGSKCLCGRLPYRSRGPVNGLLCGSGGGFDFNIDIVCGMVEFQEKAGMLDPEVAIFTANVCKTQLEETRQQLSDAGLLQNQQRNYTGQTEFARVVAPFKKSEIKQGFLLGAGGFSSVYEVSAFNPDPHCNESLSVCQIASREYLTSHALKKPVIDERGEEWTDPIARYAVKHLRRATAADPNRFARAAVDLVLEGQLLMALDHPNIIGVRGWSCEGPDAFLSRDFADYFLVLDRLSVSLEERIFEWRQTLKKARRKISFPWIRKNKKEQIQRNVLIERLKVAADIASAIDYLHDRRIMHRDIKVSNIGFDVHGDVKLFDFGLARLLPAESDRLHDGYSMSRVGTNVYMAPEVRDKQPYDVSADVYSYGTVLWQMLSLGSPKEIRQKSAKAALPICPCWPVEIQNLVDRCLSTTASERPSMSEIRRVLSDELLMLGMKPIPLTQRQRRSTFRVNLSKNELSQLEKLAEESNTSHTSSFFGSSWLQPSSLSFGPDESILART